MDKSKDKSEWPFGFNKENLIDFLKMPLRDIL